jgi:short-subunit dehydrogenase
VAVACDVTDAGQRQELLDSIAARGAHVDILINNAGIGTAHGFLADSTETQVRQIEVNAVALVALTHMVLPGMVERGSGAILNVGSTAGFQPMPRQSVYAASKAFVNSFSQGLAQELRNSGISVSVLCPGPVRTEFFGDDQERLESDSPSWAWQNADECAREGIDAMFKRKRVHVPKAVNKAGALSAKFTPARVTVEVLDRFWPVGK